MSTHRDLDTRNQDLAHPGTVHPDLADLGRRSSSTADKVWGATRIALGSIFLWAFLDKLFGLGFATPSERSWLSGGSPTAGFLGGVEGPFSGVYTAIAGQAWADWMFMLGLLGIGVALMAGVAMRFAAAAGALLLVLMWTAVLPMTNHPFLDDHLIYAMVLVGLATAGAGHTFGLGRRWEQLSVVKRFSFLR